MLNSEFKSPVCVMIALLSLSALAADNQAPARFTYTNALAVEALTSLGLGGAATLGATINGKIDTATLENLRNDGSLGSALTDEDVTRIIKRVKASPLNMLGIGQDSGLGGAQINITLDQAQYARLAGSDNAKAILTNIAKDAEFKIGLQTVGDPSTATQFVLGDGAQGMDAATQQMALVDSVKPSFVTENLNLRTIGTGGIDGLEAHLNFLKDKGIHVQQVTLRGVISRGAMSTLGSINFLITAEAAVHGTKGVYNLFQAWGDQYDTNWVVNNCGADHATVEQCKQNVYPYKYLTPLYDMAGVYYYFSR